METGIDGGARGRRQKKNKWETDRQGKTSETRVMEEKWGRQAGRQG